MFEQFRLDARDVHQMMEDSGLSRKQFLKAMVQPASQLARPPISKFNVGAVGMTPAGDVYVGVNIEFARMPLNYSIHAEQFLISNLKHHGETDVEMVAINAAPCGHCRQFFSELACSDTVQFVFGRGSPDQFSLADLLPHRFKPQDLLGDDPPPLLLRPQGLPLQLSPEAMSILQARQDDADFVRAADAALAEARESYALYSGCPAGVSIITEDGGVYSGGYIESAAYNPSLSPLHVAIIDAVIDHMPCYTHVKEAVLVEKMAMAVQHARGVQFMLEHIAPDARLTVLPCD